MLRSVRSNVHQCGARLSRSFVRPTLRLSTTTFSPADYTSALKSQSMSPKWPSSSEQLTPIDRLFGLKPALTAADDARDDSGEFEGVSEAFEAQLEEAAALEPDGEPNVAFRLGRHILRLGKVHYRSEEAMSPRFKDKKGQITSHRTSPQIRRVLKDWMIKSDREIQLAYRRRPVGWTLQPSTAATYSTNSAIATAAAAAASANDPRKGAVYGPEEAVAYAHYYMPSRYGIAKRVMREVSTLLPNFTPRRVLDFGCGPATVGLAILDTEKWNTSSSSRVGGTSKEEVEWRPQSAQHGFQHHQQRQQQQVQSAMQLYVGIDVSRAMIDAAKLAMGQSEEEASSTKGTSKASGAAAVGRIGQTDAIFWDRTADVVQRAHSRGDRFDMAVASFTLSELAEAEPPVTSKGTAAASASSAAGGNGVLHVDRNKAAAVQLLWELLDDGGLLVLIEAGNPKGSHIVRSARKLILDSFGGAGQVVGHGTSGQEQSGPLRPVLAPPAPYTTHNELGAFTVAPCTHDAPCPLGDGVWCSFSQRVHSGMVRKAAEEKFSYVVLQKRALNQYDGRYSRRLVKSKGAKKSAQAESAADAARSAPVDVWSQHRSIKPPSTSATSASDPTPVQILQQFARTPASRLDDLVDQLIDDVDWTEYSPPLYRSEYGRILRAPLKQRGHVTMDVCTPGGQVKRHVLSKSHLLEVPSLYAAVRKTTWGGLHPVLVTHDQATGGSKGSGAGSASSVGVVEEESPLCKLPAQEKRQQMLKLQQEQRKATRGLDDSKRVVAIEDDDEDDFADFDAQSDELDPFGDFEEEHGGRKKPVNRNVMRHLSPFALSSLPDSTKQGRREVRENMKSKVATKGKMQGKGCDSERSQGGLQHAGDDDEDEDVLASGVRGSRSISVRDGNRETDLDLNELMRSGKLEELLAADNDDDDDDHDEGRGGESRGGRGRRAGRSVGRQRSGRASSPRSGRRG